MRQRHGGAWLEIGPGTNHSYSFRPHLSPSPFTVYIDLETPDTIVRKQVYGAIAEWVVADAAHLPLRSGVVERLAAFHVIEHLDMPRGMASEIERVLACGGGGEIRTPGPLSKNARGDPDHKHVFTPYSLRKLFTGIGLHAYYKEEPVLATMMPRILRRIIKIIILYISDELRLHIEKKC